MYKIITSKTKKEFSKRKTSIEARWEKHDQKSAYINKRSSKHVSDNIYKVCTKIISRRRNVPCSGDFPPLPAHPSHHHLAPRPPPSHQ